VDVIGFGLLFLLFNELLRVTGQASVNNDDDDNNNNNNNNSYYCVDK